MLRKFGWQLLELLIVVGAVYLNILYGHNFLIGALVLAWYLLLTARGARLLLVKFFYLSDESSRVIWLGAFMSFYTLGLVAAVFLILYHLGALIIAIIFLLNGFVYLLSNWWAQACANKTPEVPKEDLKVLESVPNTSILVIAYLILLMVGFYLLSHSSSGDGLLSPWQAIDHRYIYVFFLSTLLLGLLVFIKIPAKFVLFFIIAQTFLLHSYLPLSHVYFYGADGWRHLAVENIIMKQGTAVVVSDHASPTGLVQNLNLGQLSYYQYWSANVILAKLLNIDLMILKRWLLPVIWSIFFPILLFEIGRALGWAKKESLFFAWLGLLPFAWAFAGSMAVPNSLGFLGWILFILMVIRRLRRPRPEQMTVLIILGVLSFFGYILYAILFWLVWLMAELSLAFKYHFKKTFWIYGLFIGISSIIIFPLIELITHYSQFNYSLNIISAIKQIGGNFTGWYLATGPYPSDITTGNVIFNQLPLSAFVTNWFVSWRWWLVIFSSVFLVFAIRGFFNSWKKDTITLGLALSTLCVFGGYIISRYFLSGDNILTRRLDPVIALFLMLLMFSGLRLWLFKGEQINKRLLAVVIIIFSAAICASYSLGPDLSIISQGEYRAASNVVNQERRNSTHCVLSDTLPLLTVEALSNKSIIGGGFPMGENFAQPERVYLYQQLLNNANENTILEAKKITGAPTCWLIAAADNLYLNDYLRKYQINQIDKTLIFKF